MHPRLYADNAATSFPKPPAVVAAMRDYVERIGASPGRGAYREAVEGGDIMSRCRRGIARLINAEAPEQIVFGLNCTDVLNLAIKGAVQPGDHVVTTVMEHNSILRPLHALSKLGVEITHVTAEPRTGRVDAAAIQQAVRTNTRLIAIQHASNVTGALQPIAEIGRLARARDILYLVDAAQTLGHLPTDVQAMQIDLLAFPGHKGLLGPLGTAGLYVRRGIEPRIRPQKEGGTGSVSETVEHPAFMPDRYESGSQNAVGIAGLGAGVEWVQQRGDAALREHDLMLCRSFLDGLRESCGVCAAGEAGSGIAASGGVALYGPLSPEERVAVFAIRVDGFEPAELSAVLDAEFGILTRSGITCAPKAHDVLGTLAHGGVTRLSFGAFTTVEDVRRCVGALASIASATSA